MALFDVLPLRLAHRSNPAIFKTCLPFVNRSGSPIAARTLADTSGPKPGIVSKERVLRELQADVLDLVLNGLDRLSDPIKAGNHDLGFHGYRLSDATAYGLLGRPPYLRKPPLLRHIHLAGRYRPAEFVVFHEGDQRGVQTALDYVQTRYRAEVLVHLREVLGQKLIADADPDDHAPLS